MKQSHKQPNLDTVTTINEDGSRFHIHPADVSGPYMLWRRIAAVVLIAIYVLLPWIPVKGNPAVFLDVLNRRFHLFGITMAAQDMWLLFFFVSGLAFLLFFVTALLGRVWCGWACPQTVFLEQVFRRLERWIDGDAIQRRVLDRAPWTPAKAVRRVIKHVLFIVLSAIIAHIFLAYFVSLPQLWDWMRQSPLEHWKVFVFMVVSTGLLYLNFAWFREQLCIVICPYGRVQSALVDEHSLNVAYDARRGDPPGHVQDPDAGDCIDCHRCVQVCPTGIDIRQGLQLECIGCCACIDACDEIMVKVKRPKGLIRYASDQGLLGLKTNWIRPRTLLYSALLLLGMGVAGFSFSGIEKAVASVTRMPGSPFYVSDTHVRNQYQIRLINKHVEALTFTVEAIALVDGFPLQASGFTERTVLQPLQEENGSYVLQVPRSDYQGPFGVELRVSAEPGSIRLVRNVEFLGPDPKLLQSRP